MINIVDFGLIQKGILHLYSVEKLCMCHTVSMVVIQTNMLETPLLPEIPDVLRPRQSSPNHTLLRADKHGSNYLWPYTQHWLTKTSCMRLELEDITPQHTAQHCTPWLTQTQVRGSGMINSDAEKERQVEIAVVCSQKAVKTLQNIKQHAHTHTRQKKHTTIFFNFSHNNIRLNFHLRYV